MRTLYLVREKKEIYIILLSSIHHFIIRIFEHLDPQMTLILLLCKMSHLKERFEVIPGVTCK